MTTTSKALLEGSVTELRRLVTVIGSDSLFLCGAICLLLLFLKGLRPPQARQGGGCEAKI